MYRYILFILLGLFISCKKEIIIDPSYAVGHIVYFERASSKSPASVAYYFFVNGKEYSNVYSSNSYGAQWVLPSNTSYSKGDKFMVQYNSNDSSVSRMLFDYHVDDSATDYPEYVAQFQTHPPK